MGSCCLDSFSDGFGPVDTLFGGKVPVDIMGFLVEECTFLASGSKSNIFFWFVDLVLHETHH